MSTGGQTMLSREEAIANAVNEATKKTADSVRAQVAREFDLAELLKKSLNVAGEDTGLSSSLLQADHKRMFAEMLARVQSPQLFVHENLDALNENDFIRGYTMILEQNSKFPADLLHATAHSQVMLFRVSKLDPATGSPLPIHESEFDLMNPGFLARLNSAAPQKTAAEPSLSCAAFFGTDAAAATAVQTNNNEEETNHLFKDQKKWIAALGVDGRMGLYRHDLGEETYEYYLFVHIGETQASRDLQKFAFQREQSRQGTPMSVAEVYTSREYEYTQSINRRNAQRLAAKVARALDLSVDLVADTLAHVGNEHEMFPMMAIPSAHNEYNVIRSIVWNQRNCFALYDNTYATTDSKEAMVLMQSPQASLLVFPNRASPGSIPVFSDVIPASSPAAVTNSYSSNAPLVLTKNAAANSFPCSAGRISAVSPGAAAAAASNAQWSTGLIGSTLVGSLDLRKDEISLINRRLTWEGKPALNAFSSSTVGQDQRTGGSSNIQSQLSTANWYNTRVASRYKALDLKDARLRSKFSQLYGSNDLLHVKKLAPIFVKISSDAEM
jgi:hypothetical protein